MIQYLTINIMYSIIISGKFQILPFIVKDSFNCAIAQEDNNNPYELKFFFGRDSKRMYRACKMVMNDWLYKYEGCYHANHPSRIELKRTLRVPEGSTFKDKAKKAIDQWYDEHPGEREKEVASKEAWTCENKRHFGIVYGIAKKHGLYMEWLGDGNPSLGDQWIIHKKHKRVAILCIQ